ncbi:hypothetical protein M9H77_34272 [Catharanthus roseus]|uniref:Uncharacterized protein n=1 Tax=Catharanthus roseus TaxID=4058 RepID=A0ACB9ZMV2_CATRO|nr:hypothetical protein M9H77_34272 [Catharanthus roseus]
MEEVPAHVHPGPIVPDVLSRQHEHRSGFIWIGDHETLQIWAWSCIPTLQPQLITEIQADPLAPLGAIWCTSFDYQLDFMPSDQFIWLPYYDRPLVPSDLWRAEVPLICYEIVEYHYPGRVIR